MHTPGAPRDQSRLLEKDLFVQPLHRLTVQQAVLSVFLNQSCVNISTTSSESDFPERRPEDSGGVGRDPARADSRTRGFYSGLALGDSGQDPGPRASLCPCRKGGRERLRPRSAQDRFPACCWPGAGVCAAIPGRVVLYLLHTGGVPRPPEPAGSPLGHREGFWVGDKLAKPPQARAEMTLSHPPPRHSAANGPHLHRGPRSSCSSAALTADGPQRASLRLEDSDRAVGRACRREGRQDRETRRRGGMDIPAGRVRLSKSSWTGRPLGTMTLSCAHGCVHWPAVPQGEECTQVRGRQLCAAAARVGCEYHGPPPTPFRTAATDSRRLALQLQPPPQTQE